VGRGQKKLPSSSTKGDICPDTSASPGKKEGRKKGRYWYRDAKGGGPKRRNTGIKRMDYGHSQKKGKKFRKEHEIIFAGNGGKTEQKKEKMFKGKSPGERWI